MNAAFHQGLHCLLLKIETKNSLESYRPQQNLSSGWRRSAYASVQTDQRFFYSLLGSIISKLATGEFSIFQLVSVAKETGLSLALSETQRQVFATLRPNGIHLQVMCKT